MADNLRNWNLFALLLIDVQRDLWPETMAEGFPHFPTNISRLLDLCRAENIDIVHLCAFYRYVCGPERFLVGRH